MNFKLKLFICFLLAGGLFFTAIPVFSAPNINELTVQVAEKAGYDASDNTNTALAERVGKIIKIALTMIGTIFVALTVYSGFLWMTASGNEDQVKKATNILKTAVIGLVITMASYGISRFVVTASMITSGQGVTQVGGSGTSQYPWYTKEYWVNYGEGVVKAWDDLVTYWKW